MPDIRRPCLLLALIYSLVVIVPAESGDAVPYLNELLKSAEEKKLHKDRYWEVLLHYKHKALKAESLIDDPKFFLSRDGKTDPEAELTATIKGFFEIDKTDDTHPRCRFPARYAWLKEKLAINEAGLPPVECKKYKEAINFINPKSAVLIFPTFFMNNPASMFGHTLIRIDTTYESKLISHAVSYSAFVERSNDLTYILKGLFGFHKGYYTVLPYYERVGQYNDIDQRDMWEYYLNLSEEEVMKMAMHLWELQEIYSYYYFFDENCSYNLLFLLESARPSLYLSHDTGLWVIPVDTIRKVKSAGLIHKTEYRPSMATKIRHIAGLLNGGCQDMAVSVADGKLEAEEVLNKRDIDREGKIMILDLAVEHIQSKYTRGELSKEDYLKLFLATLQARGKLGRIDEDLYKIKTPSLPEDGHPSSRLTLSAGRKRDRFFEEIGFRPAYHDLLDPDEGYIEGSQIGFGNTALRYYPSLSKLKLQRLDFIDIMSLSPRSKFFKPVSWKVKTGLIQKTFPDMEDYLLYQLNPGAGVAFKNNTLGIAYIMVESDINIGDEFKDKYSVGAGCSSGLIKSLTGLWKGHLFMRGIFYELGHKHQAFELTLSQRFKINRSNSITIDISREKVFDIYQTEAKLSYNLFF